MNTAAFLTFGCKINQYETEAIREQVTALGYEEVDPSGPADVYVVNTCSVTAEGFAKSRRSILRAARANPLGRILVLGCSTPREKESLRAIRQVEWVAGNEEKHLVGSFLTGTWSPGSSVPPLQEGPWSLRISGFSDRTRASVKVQDGCNSFCSFCIVPFLRGRSRSRPAQDVTAEVRRLVDNGYREIVLSGIHIQDYGVDLEGGRGLPWLLRRVSEVPGLWRVRLSSLGVAAMTPELIDALRHPVFCPHWHLPLQSGSDPVLRAMRRGYTVADFLDAVDRLQSSFPEPSISSDVIVGYPEETVADFSRTLDVCRRVGFSKIHVFPYSRRDGTLASKLGRELPVGEVRRRARVLRELEAELALCYKTRFLGRDVQVLVEGRARNALGEDAGGPTHEGFTERYVRVRWPVAESSHARPSPGSLQTVRIDRVDSRVAWGVTGSGRELPERGGGPHGD
jgi:threonylcarbamoyladenosine tRNA methylthiotransferase MtaB